MNIKYGSILILGLLLWANIAQAQQAEDADAAQDIDYREVAEDARKIAGEIEERLIEQDMEEGSAKIAETNVAEGYPKINEAYLDMEEMIAFCESTGGKAGKACKFKLRIKMGLNPGNTLGQLMRGMTPGQGNFGNFGQGAAGNSGGQTPFGVFGPEFGGKPNKNAKRLGNKKTPDARMAEGTPDPLAGGIETLNAAKNFDLEIEAEGGERVMEEYRGLIEAYFKRLSEEE